MAGREKIRCYKYDKTGKYIQKYDAISEVRNEYYNEIAGKFPLFRNNDNIHLLPDDTVLFKARVGKSNAVKGWHIMHNPLKLSKRDLGQAVEMYNIDDVKIAEFKSIGIASKLLGIQDSLIRSKLNRKDLSRTPFNKLKIYFKYRE